MKNEDQRGPLKEGFLDKLKSDFAQDANPDTGPDQLKQSHSSDCGSLTQAFTGACEEKKKEESYLLDEYSVKENFSFGYTCFLMGEMVLIERNNNHQKRIFRGREHQIMVNDQVIAESFLPHLNEVKR